MTLPQASPEDVQEQQVPLLEEPPVSDDPMPEGASEADAADQRLEVSVDDEDAPIG